MKILMLVMLTLVSSQFGMAGNGASTEKDRALDKIRRQEMIRPNWHVIDQSPQQTVVSNGNVEISVFDLSSDLSPDRLILKIWSPDEQTWSLDDSAILVPTSYEQLEMEAPYFVKAIKEADL